MFFPPPPKPELESSDGPPEVVVDSKGVEVRFCPVPQPRIEWHQIREVAVDVVNYGGGRAEAFWHLGGDGIKFGAPVELVVGSTELNARLFALPGFDMNAYRQARAAEAQGKPGWFWCWRGDDGVAGSPGCR
jgi:hypothetical protein